MFKLNPTIIFSLLFVFNLYPQSVYKGAGTAGNIFLRLDQSTHAASLSGAYTAIARDENALFYNPAGLANIHRGALGLNHTQWFEDIRIDNVVFGYNFDRKLGLALSMAHLWMPSIQGKDAFGQNTNEVNVSSSMAMLGLGYKVHPSFYAGLAIKYYSDNLAGYKAEGLALDAGILMHLIIPGMTFGASVQNLGSKLQYNMEKESLPLTLRGGLAYKIPRIGLRFSAELVKAKDTDFFYASGIEYTFVHTFSLRIGNQFRAWQNLNPVFGAGLNISERYLFDYTFYAHNDLGATHRIGFTFRFNIPATRFSRKYYSAKKETKTLSAPQRVSAQIISDKLFVKWQKVAGSRYNVYARSSKEKPWKKLNRHPLYANQMEFKKPAHKCSISIVVSSVMGDAESAFSKEVIINVQ